MSYPGPRQTAAEEAGASVSPVDDAIDGAVDVDVDADVDVDVDNADETADLPLTMSASTVLLALPRDATAALAAAGSFGREKVVVRFKAVGAPALMGAGANGGDVRRKIAATQKFDVVVAFVRRALRVRPTESVFLYVNSTFAPALDEVVGNLHQCFKDANDQLNVAYSLTPAFG